MFTKLGGGRIKRGIGHPYTKHQLICYLMPHTQCELISKLRLHWFRCVSQLSMTEIQLNTQPKQYWYKPEFISPNHKPEIKSFLWCCVIKGCLKCISTLLKHFLTIIHCFWLIMDIWSVSITVTLLRPWLYHKREVFTAYFGSCWQQLLTVCNWLTTCVSTLYLPFLCILIGHRLCKWEWV